MDYKKLVKEKKEHPIYGEMDPKGIGEATGAGEHFKKYLGVKFECCSVYTRAYRNREGTAYLARCPRCGYQVKIGIDAQEGTNSRFFVVK